MDYIKKFEVDYPLFIFYLTIIYKNKIIIAPFKVYFTFNFYLTKRRHIYLINYLDNILGFINSSLSNNHYLIF